jgi:hypothetical protein
MRILKHHLLNDTSTVYPAISFQASQTRSVSFEAEVFNLPDVVSGKF